jgi:hypothetical protein
MKTRPHFLNAGSLITAMAFFGMIPSYCAPTDNPTSNKHVAESNAVPQSVFIVPTNDAEGRDPFYPKSERFQKRVIPLDTSKPVPVIPLVLKGLSGTGEHKLAIINGKTLAEGEEADITTSAGRTTVRLIEIKEKSVIIEVLGERRELRLGSGN